ncbi:Caleosin-related [Parasponia andersonii]|uniref:Caleosin-related n=1 Tax=Parasponia andersonii TaxID=3476 RepID=A0A2P5C370_PARAD|nr:Caleosin-related [Parasponia andersonii]
MATQESNDAVATVAEKAPITAEKKVRTDLETKLPNQSNYEIGSPSFNHTPSSDGAPDTENVNGTWGHKHQNMSVLQQHAAFSDQNNDGIIYPLETYRGPKIGYWKLGIFGFLTWIPSPFFPIYIKNLRRAKHGSDSGTFDTEGRYIPSNFENMFSKYARSVPDRLTLGELWHMTEANRNALDFFGWIDERGFLSKEAVRRCFDGSLFEYCDKVRNGDVGKRE